MNKPSLISENKAALDSAFPSLALMGFCFLLAIVCIVICAWKIILLEQEQREITQERLLLQRDKDAFMSYGGDLPKLGEEHRQLTLQVASLTESRGELEKNIEALRQKENSLRMRAGGLAGTIATLEAQAEATRAEAARAAAELGKLRPELEALRKEVANMKAQDSGLDESIAKKRKYESTLAANIAGLERSQAHTQEFLAKINTDRDFYLETHKSFERALAKLEETLSRTSALTGVYAGRLEEMGKFKTTLDQGMAVLSADLKGAASNLEAIKEARASHAALLKQEAEQGKLLREHVADVAQNNKKLAASLELVQDLDKKLQAALAAESATMQKLAQEDAETRARLAATAETLSKSVDNFKSDQGKIQATLTDLGNLLNERKAESKTLLDLAVELASLAEKNRETTRSGIQVGAVFGEAARTLQKQAEELKTALDQGSEQGRRFGQVLDADMERQKEVAILIKEAREEITMSRRQSMELQAILEKLKASEQEEAPKSKEEPTAEKAAQ